MSHVRFVYFIFLIITMIPERELQLLDVPFLYEKLISFIFPKEPGIVRVRKMEENNELKGEPVLDFVSTLISFFNLYKLKLFILFGSPCQHNACNIQKYLN